MNSLIARSLSKSFKQGDRTILLFDDLTITIKSGEKVAIMGRSGAGKSTLLHLLGGLEKPALGDVEIMGHMIYSMSPSKQAQLRNQYLGFVYQFHHLLPEFTALENTAMPLLIRGFQRRQALQQANTQLQQLHLGNRTDHRPSELSGGERQRVAIARALITKPACILADEPTGNLDPQTANQVFETLLKNTQTSLLIVTHDETLAKRMDRVLQLTDGKLSHSVN